MARQDAAYVDKQIDLLTSIMADRVRSDSVAGCLRGIMGNRGPMETKPSEWYVIGIVMGASVTATIAVLLLTLDWHKGIIEWAREWQTLVTGFMALGGAYLSVRWIQRQIDHARELEADRIERKHFADRATLAAALADIVVYAERSLAALKRIPEPGRRYPTLIEVPDGWAAPRLPRVPTSAVETIRACIETARPQPRDEMASLLSHLQISNSRLHDVFEEEFVSGSRHAFGVHEMHTHFADFVELHLRSDRMTRYARGETPTIENPATIDGIVTRSIFSGLEHYPGYLDEVRRRYREKS